jgi:hypothetical protein
MKTFILSEKALNTVKGQMLNESYGDKIALVKKFLDKNYMRGYLEKNNPGGTKGNFGVFIQLNNGLPTKSSVWLDDVVDTLEHEANYHKLIANELERKGLFYQIAKDWFNQSKTLDSGILSSYDFLKGINKAVEKGVEKGIEKGIDKVVD